MADWSRRRSNQFFALTYWCHDAFYCTVENLNFIENKLILTSRTGYIVSQLVTFRWDWRVFLFYKVFLQQTSWFRLLTLIWSDALSVFVILFSPANFSYLFQNVYYNQVKLHQVSGYSQFSTSSRLWNSCYFLNLRFLFWHDAKWNAASQVSRSSCWKKVKSRQKSSFCSFSVLTESEKNNCQKIFLSERCCLISYFGLQ